MAEYMIISDSPGKPYHDTALKFLKATSEEPIRAVAMVALMEGGNSANIVATWNCGPFETAEISGVLQLLAAGRYMDVNRQREGEEDGGDGT